jgi:hypothetical protein
MRIDNKLIGQIIKSIRASKSQGYITLKLKHSSNIISKWESGQVRITWKDFVSLCNVCKINIDVAFENYFHYYGDILNQSDLLAFIVGNQKILKLAEQTSISYDKFLRLQKGETPLYVVDFFQILSRNEIGQLIGFLEQLIELSKLPAFKEHYEEKQKIINFSYKNPDMAAVYGSLKINQAKNKTSIEQVAIECGLDLKNANELIKKMLELEILSQVKGKISTQSLDIADDRGNKDGVRNVRAHWLKKAIATNENQEMLQPKDRDSFGSIVFPTTYKTREKIISLYLKFFDDMKQAVVDDVDEPELLQVLSFQLFNPKNSLIKK